MISYMVNQAPQHFNFECLSFLVMAGIKPIPLRIALALSFSITAWAHNPTVEWIKCPVGVTSPVECGQIQVPLDHATPDGETITLSLTRLQATNPGCGPRQGLYM